MRKYESPTIEQAGGNGEMVNPQVIALLSDFNVLAEWVYIWVFYKVATPPLPVNYIEA